jgi:hypothetical protein
LAAAAARSAAEIMARHGGTISDDAILDAVDRFRILVLDALEAATEATPR